MPQNPLAATVAKSPSKTYALMNVDAEGNLLTATGQTNSTLNITAETLVKASAGRIGNISVIVGSASAGAVYDSNTVGGASQANQIFAIPANAPVGTYYQLSFPTLSGIVVTPGTSGVLAVSWS